VGIQLKSEKRGSRDATPISTLGFRPYLVAQAGGE